MPSRFIVLSSAATILFTGCGKWVLDHLPKGEEGSTGGSTGEESSSAMPTGGDGTTKGISVTGGDSHDTVTSADGSTEQTTASITEAQPTTSAETETSPFTDGMPSSGTADSAGLDTSTGENQVCADQQGCEPDQLRLEDCSCRALDDVRFVFVTSVAGSGAKEPDSFKICDLKDKTASKKLPAAAVYRAWRADTLGQPAQLEGFEKFAGPYVKLNSGADGSFDAIRIAEGWDSLVGNNLLTPIDVTEKGEEVTPPLRAWTGLSSKGENLDEEIFFTNCGNWKDANKDGELDCENDPDNFGVWGDVKAVDSSWSGRAPNMCVSREACCHDAWDVLDLDSYECDNEYRVYCFQQK